MESEENKRKFKENEKDLKITVGKRFRQLREEYGLSQEEMAEEIGITPRQIYNYESGVSGIPDTTKIQIRKRFSVSIDQLLFRNYKRNEAKHEMRRIRHHIFGGYEEGMIEYMNSVFSKEEPEETVMEKLEYERFKEALDKLPPAQKRRCILYFYHGLSEKEIAKAEGVSQQMVSLSLDGALKNLKKYLKL